MAKYDVTFSCGHTATIELFGKEVDRQKKIAFYEEQGFCPECYKAMKDAENADGCEEREMHYSDYKNNYEDCKTKSGSYNKETKTIVVYVPFDYDAKKECIKELKDINIHELNAIALIKGGSENAKEGQVPADKEELKSQVIAILEKYGY